MSISQQVIQISRILYVFSCTKIAMHVNSPPNTKVSLQIPKFPSEELPTFPIFFTHAEYPFVSSI